MGRSIKVAAVSRSTVAGFVGTAMALDTVLEVPDPFLEMLGADPRGRMLVAAVAGEPGVVAGDVAGGTGRIVFTFQGEESGVVERCRVPRLGSMTLLALTLDDLVQ